MSISSHPTRPRERIVTTEVERSIESSCRYATRAIPSSRARFAESSRTMHCSTSSRSTGFCSIENTPHSRSIARASIDGTAVITTVGIARRVEIIHAMS